MSSLDEYFQVGSNCMEIFSQKKIHNSTLVNENRMALESEIKFRSLSSLVNRLN